MLRLIEIYQVNLEENMENPLYVNICFNFLRFLGHLSHSDGLASVVVLDALCVVY